jgi:hypothetical protein
LLNMQTIYEVVVKWKIKWHINPKKWSKLCIYW